MEKYIYSNNIKLIIFDLDGTLYPRELYHKDYYDFTIESIISLFNLNRSNTIKTLNDFGITSNPEENQGSVSALINSLGMSVNEWNLYRDKNFNIVELIKPNYQLVSNLNFLNKYYKIVIFTNNTKVATEKILKKIGITNEPTIDLILTSDFGLKLKPHKDGFKYIKEKFNLPFSEIVSIGDRKEVDIKPLIELGGNGILVSNPEELLNIRDLLNN